MPESPPPQDRPASGEAEMTMEVQDVRKLSSQALEDLRRRVVAAVSAGASQAEVARLFRVSRPTVNRWVQAHRERGEDSFRPRKRGRRCGQRRSLSTSQQTQIAARITDRYPEELGLDHPLWTRQAVQELIAQQHDVRLSLTTVSTYLRRWGFTLPDPLPHALERNPAAVRHWRAVEYSALARSAHTRNAVILWVTWLSLQYSSPGHGLAKRADGEQLWHVNVLSASSNRGSVFFFPHEGPCDGDMLREFLERLSRQLDRRMHVIVDLFAVDRPEPAWQWLRDQGDAVTPHFPLSGLDAPRRPVRLSYVHTYRTAEHLRLP